MQILNKWLRQVFKEKEIQKCYDGPFHPRNVYDTSLFYDIEI